MNRVLAFGSVLALGIAIAPLRSAEPAEAGGRHAGRVVAVDAEAGRLAIDEMAPGAQVRRIEARVPAGTPVVVVRREPREVVFGNERDGREILTTYRWVEEPADLAAARPGDFAVVVLDGASDADAPAVARRVEVMPTR